MEDFPDHLTIVDSELNDVQRRIDNIFSQQQEEGQLGGKKAPKSKRKGTKRKLPDLLYMYLGVASFVRKKTGVKLGPSMKMAKKIVLDFQAKNPSVKSIEEVVKGASKLFEANPGKYK